MHSQVVKSQQSPFSLNLKADSSIAAVERDGELKRLLEPASPAELSKRNLEEEFSILNRIADSKEHRGRLVQEERLAHLNRYSYVLPYKDNLVRLDDAEELSPGNYINASFISNPMVAGEENNFIATQGPLESTQDAFWKLIERYQVKYVFGIVEKNLMGSKCHKYWPLDSFPIETPAFSVFKEEDNESRFVQERLLRVVNRQTGHARMVRHFYLGSWTDNAAVDKADVVEFIALLKRLDKLGVTGGAPPVVVHCSAGIGRTGTLICSYYLYQYWKACLAEGRPFEFSVFHFVRHLREQRQNAIQSVEQYKFLYEVSRMFEK